MTGITPGPKGATWAWVFPDVRCPTEGCDGLVYMVDATVRQIIHTHALSSVWGGWLVTPYGMGVKYAFRCLDCGAVGVIGKEATILPTLLTVEGCQNAEEREIWQRMLTEQKRLQGAIEEGPES